MSSSTVMILEAQTNAQAQPIHVKPSIISLPNVPWYSESTERLRGRVTTRSINPIVFSQLLSSTVTHSVPISIKRPPVLDEGTDDRRKRKLEQHQSTATTNTNLQHCIESGCLEPEALSSRYYLIPRSVSQFDHFAVMWQKAINMASARAIADTMQPYCVPNFVYTTVCTNAEGKSVTSSQHVTVGWDEFINKRSQTFISMPDGVFSLHDVHTFRRHGKILVQCDYSFDGTILVPTLLIPCPSPSATVAPAAVAPASKRHKSYHQCTLSLPSDIFPGSQDVVPTVDCDRVFAEDGLPNLSLQQEVQLFQSGTWTEVEEDRTGYGFCCVEEDREKEETASASSGLALNPSAAFSDIQKSFLLEQQVADVTIPIHLVGKFFIMLDNFGRIERIDFVYGHHH